MAVQSHPLGEGQNASLLSSVSEDPGSHPASWRSSVRPRRRVTPCADAYARIRAELSAAGQLIGPHNLMIALIAVAHGLVVVTHITREFSPVGGLEIEDWLWSPYHSPRSSAYDWLVPASAYSIACPSDIARSSAQVAAKASSPNAADVLPTLYAKLRRTPQARQGPGRGTAGA